MNKDLKFSVSGFSPKRMAWLLVATDLGFLPVQVSTESWRVNSALSDFAIVVAVSCFLLGIITSKKEKGRFNPALWASILAIVQYFLQIL